MKRIVSFARGLVWLARQRLLSRHNVRAIWLQHTGSGDWVSAFDDLTDSEFEAFLDAIK